MSNPIILIRQSLQKFTPEGRKLALSVLRENKGTLLSSLPDTLEVNGVTKTLEAKLKSPKDSIRKIINNVISNIKKCGVKREPGTALNVVTKVQEPIFLTHSSENILEAFNIDGKRIGLAELDRSLVKPWLSDAEQSLHLKFLATSPEYKGVGSEMIREIVHISKDSGFSGNVSLEACTGSIPSEFMRICGYEKACGPEAVSAAIKYSKMGFVSSVDGMQEKIMAEIAQGGNGMRRSNSAYHGYKDILTGPMELSKEAINKYLLVPSVIK